ncbi:MAG: M20/M25/M40 family metallo-hydrolase [Anaerolineales bacterium]|nr:M20/M25/M40 family metallo-hydrolase [Anaerolineales bacterium]
MTDTMPIKLDFDRLVPRVVDLAVAIQQIPAPTFAEKQRGAFIQERFRAEGLHDVASDDLGNVYARLPGAGECPPLVISAHMDTVFPASTDLALRRSADQVHGPGIGDNSLGVAGLFGLLWALKQGAKKPSLPGDLWFVANVCEEGLGDLRGMHAVVDRFGGQVLAYLILEGMALGQIYHRALGVQRYRICVQTNGGHSWVDYGAPSAIHELAAIVIRLAALPVPGMPRSSLNVGVIAGGTSINTIAPEAHLELDLRSEAGEVLRSLARASENLVAAANRAGVQASFEIIGQRPSGEIPATHPLVLLAQRCLLAQGVQPNLAIGSTDANAPLSRGLPAVCLGLSTGHGAHTVGEYIHIQPLAQGLAQLLAVVTGAFQELA